MSCEAMRAAMHVNGGGEWPPEVVAHLATCDACIEAAIALALRQRPTTAVPASFAVDVARRARVDVPIASGLSRGVLVALTGSILAFVVLAVWLAAAGADRAALPITALLLAFAEGIVLVAWTMQIDVVSQRFRA